MKTLTMIFVSLLVSIGVARAQNIEPSSPEYHYLDSVARWAIGKFGEEGYSKMCENVKPKIILRKFVSTLENNGRECYEVKYMQDSSKPVRLEYNHIAKVIIWKDTKEAYSIAFGNGWGHFDLPKMLEDEKNGKPFPKVAYQLTNWDSLKMEWKKAREEWEAVERRLKAKAHEEYQKKMAKIREERERQDSLRNEASRNSTESKE